MVDSAHTYSLTSNAITRTRWNSDVCGQVLHGAFEQCFSSDALRKRHLQVILWPRLSGWVLMLSGSLEFRLALGIHRRSSFLFEISSSRYCVVIWCSVRVRQKYSLLLAKIAFEIAWAARLKRNTDCRPNKLPHIGTVSS